MIMNKMQSLIFILALNSLFIFSQTNLKTVNKLVNFGQKDTTNRSIDAIIIHTSFVKSKDGKYNINSLIKEFAHYQVSAHYVIGREGTIYKLVDEKNIAYHAGKSCMPDGRVRVNSFSIGIEVMNSKSDSLTQKQLTALTSLVKDIQSRYKINYILRHSDIAQGRKTDPWNMNWEDFLKRIN